MNNKYENKINAHYAKKDMFDSILVSIKEAGFDPDNLTRDVLSSFEEFHIGGRDATRLLAEFAQLKKGSKVLDIGCGIGGPARTLADEYDCIVTGVDITEEFIKTAKELTKLVGLDNKTNFQIENATNLSLGANSFDIIWMQHVNMNIEEKDKLFSEVYRVLKPLGQLVFYEVLKLNDVPLTFPVLWAGEQELSHLINEESYRRKLEEVGLFEVRWEDRTLFAIEWFEELSVQKQKEESHKLNLSQVINKNIPEKVVNVLQNLKDKKICVVQAVYSKRS